MGGLDEGGGGVRNFAVCARGLHRLECDAKKSKSGLSHATLVSVNAFSASNVLYLVVIVVMEIHGGGGGDY